MVTHVQLRTAPYPVTLKNPDSTKTFGHKALGVRRWPGVDIKRVPAWDIVWVVVCVTPPR
jgi:hypothetical protein